MQNITLYFENIIYEIWNSRLYDNPVFYANLKYSLYIPRQQTSLAPRGPNVDPVGSTLSQRGPNVHCYLDYHWWCATA